MFRSSPLILLLAASCVIRITQEHETFDIPQEPSLLVVDVDAGEIRVVGRDVSSTTVQVDSEFGGSAEPEIEVFMVGDVLHVEADCPPSIRHCLTDVEIELPYLADVQAETGAGDVAIHDVHDNLDVHTGAGDVQAQNPTSDARLDTGAGDIVATGVRGRDVQAHTGAGAIDLVFTRTPERVEANTGTGPVDLMVPAGRYDIDATTGVGRVSLDGVVHDPDASSSLEAHSGAGNVTITGYLPLPEYLPPCSADQGDPYTIDSASISDDHLVVDTSASGGCADHTWTLCWPDGAFMESWPVQARLDLLHDDHDDPCDSIVQETVRFDLAPMREAYDDMVGSEHGTILLHLHDTTNTYTF